MKTICTTVLTLAFVFSQAQQVKWALKTNESFPHTGLICDQSGNLYQYGTFQPSDSIYTVITKYSPAGTVLFRKTMRHKSFVITKMIYDGAGSFYFSGRFSGDPVVDGNSLHSRGYLDGFCGKMDENCLVEWINSFGGSNTDSGEGICFDDTQNTVVVTGGFPDSIYVNNTLVAACTKHCMGFLVFDVAGNFNKHKLFDFYPSRNDQVSRGNEIHSDPGGNYLVLGLKEGRYFDEPVTSQNSSMEQAGFYAFKFDHDLNMVWSELIAYGCYYGMSCKRASVAANGDFFVPYYCDSKHNGHGYLRRLRGSDGGFVNECDGVNQLYWNTQYDKDGLIYVTKEDYLFANENSKQGYDVIRKVNDSQQTIEEIKIMDNCRLTDFLKDKDGTLYVTGISWGGPVIIGTDTIFANDGFTGVPYFTMALKGLSNATGLADANKTSNTFRYSVFPNPSSGVFGIELYADAKYKLNVCNSIGQEVSTKNISGAGRAEVDLSHCQPGIYFLEINSGSEKRTHKLCVE